MSQSKAQSFKETLSNTGIGMVGSWIITMVTFNFIKDYFKKSNFIRLDHGK